MTYICAHTTSPMQITLRWRQVIGGSNIGRAQDLPLSHFNELCVRHEKQVWHANCVVRVRT